jgi:shikimate dehydrogenase
VKNFGILAFPAKHSKSPEIHNRYFQERGVSGVYNYYEIKPENLADFFKNLRSNNIYGLSVSLPFKEEVMNFLDVIKDDAKALKAVNTVVRNKEDQLVGLNTDFIGSNRALLDKTTLSGKSAVVIGAGGAARAVIYGLLKEGVEQVTIVNRTFEKAQKLAKEFKIKACHWTPKALEELDKFNILVHTSSIWTLQKNFTEEEINNLFPKSFLAKCQDAVMDIAYKPLMTPLLNRAQEMGLKIICGDKMLQYQAIEQQKIWLKEVFSLDF